MSNTALQLEPQVEPYSKIDPVKAFRLRVAKNMTYQEIAKQFNTSPQAVEQRLKRFKALIADPELVKAYEENKQHLLSEVESRLLVQLVDPKKLKEASLNNVAYSVSQVNNMNRLARGEATQNIDIKSMQVHSQTELDESVKAREELMKIISDAEVG
jgi:predicted DNA-binding protein YlxM (UPF0122 family)